MIDYNKILYDNCSEELKQIQTMMSEYKTNPLYWSNNKRRLNGLKPLRNKCDHRNPPTSLLWKSFDILDACLRKCVPDLIEQAFVCMTDFKSINLEERTKFIELHFYKED